MLTTIMQGAHQEGLRVDLQSLLPGDGKKALTRLAELSVSRRGRICAKDVFFNPPCRSINFAFC